MKDWKQDFPQIAKALETSRMHGRTGQAYLFIGDTADSLRNFAMGWAMTAACQTMTADGSACHHCSNCRLFEANAYSELITLEPQSKIRVIKIDALREFDRKLWLATPENMLQIGLIADADCMNAEAQNALLKTLEEPPERTMIVLLTCHPLMLLPTIRSRCQNILLLKNRVDYSAVVSGDFMEALAKLRRGAGTRVAFEVSSKISSVFAALHEKAEEFVDENWTMDQDNAGGDADSTLRRQIAQVKEEKVSSEYLRMRMSHLECIQAWFQQRLLMAVRAPDSCLPQNEFMQWMQTPGSVEEASADLAFVNQYFQALNANVDEGLALDAFCLSVCEKK